MRKPYSMPLQPPRRTGGKSSIGAPARGNNTSRAPAGVTSPRLRPPQQRLSHPQPAKRLTPSQVRTLVLQRLTEAYGASWEKQVSDHLWGGGDMYPTILF